MVQDVSEHIKSTDVGLGTLETKEETSARGDIDGPRDSEAKGPGWDRILGYFMTRRPYSES